MGIFNYRRPMIMVALVNIIGFLVLMFLNDMDTTVLYYGAAVFLMLEISYFVLCRMSMEDQYIFLIVAMLFSIGEIMLFRLDPAFGKKQIIWFSVSLVCFFIAYIIVQKTDILSKAGFLYFGGAILVFIITVIFGRTVNGARNWIIIGSFSVQTSEIIKFLVVFMIADRYTNPARYKFKKFTEGVVFSAMIYAVLLCMVIQREWGTAVVIFLVHISMMFVFHEDTKIMLVNLALAVVGCALGALLLSHIQTRIEVWLDPWSDIEGKGYQIT
ncbi:MAG: FtsW/RodA/SpoVE family cell cycle protein, partial [Clostridia bacterium]|nr:FtsW/RodA/SpoVE family cell cycle protein [Clostridia bacterium]